MLERMVGYLGAIVGVAEVLPDRMQITNGAGKGIGLCMTSILICHYFTERQCFLALRRSACFGIGQNSGAR
jgi:hypothetical protein